MPTALVRSHSYRGVRFTGMRFQHAACSAALGLSYDELVNLAWENIEMGEIP